MFLFTTLFCSAFAQEPETISGDELVVSSKGRLIILRSDNTWEEVPSERAACHSKIEKGYTERDGFSFSTRGDIFLQKGKAFSYIVRSYPDKSENVYFELYRTKSTFKEHFDLIFHDYHFFRSLEFDLVKVPFRGWSFQFNKHLESDLMRDLRTKHIKTFETHKHTFYPLADFSAREFRSNIQCLYDSVYSYLNTPQSLENKEKYQIQKEEYDKQKAEEEAKKKAEEEAKKKKKEKKKKKKDKKKDKNKEEQQDAPASDGTPPETPL